MRIGLGKLLKMEGELKPRDGMGAGMGMNSEMVQGMWHRHRHRCRCCGSRFSKSASTFATSNLNGCMHHAPHRVWNVRLACTCNMLMSWQHFGGVPYARTNRAPTTPSLTQPATPRCIYGIAYIHIWTTTRMHAYAKHTSCSLSLSLSPSLIYLTHANCSARRCACTVVSPTPTHCYPAT